MTLFRKMIVGLCALLLGGMATMAQAGDCSYTFDTSTASYRFTVPPTIALTGTEAPGTVLWTSNPVLGDKTVWSSCPGRAGSAGLIDWWGGATSSLGGYNVLPTNIAGIGYVISITSYPAGIQTYPANPDGDTPSNNYNTLNATLRFIKTSQAYFSGTSAPLDRSGDLATWHVGTNKLRLATFYISTSTTFTKPGGGGGQTCSVAPVTVPLGTVKEAVLNNGGSSESTRFLVRLTCPSRVTSIKYSIRPQDAIVGNACDGTMQASSSSGANNVGINITDEIGDPVCWNQEADTFRGGTSLTRFAIPFVAKMIAIRKPVTPGMVRGSAVITFFIQ